MQKCDLCEFDGYDRSAYFEYTTKDQVNYSVCKKHAKIAKEAGFKVIPLTVCDLCKIDGYTKAAVGFYFAEDGKEYHICTKHKKIVKESGFEVFNL